MTWTKALVASVLMLSVAFAGCAGGSDDPIQYTTPADPATEAFVFKSGVTADTYAWDFGDGRTAEGQEVEHLYGVTDATFRVRLTTTVADVPTKHETTIVLGTGENAAPTFSLGVSTDWAVTGEEVTFTTAGSTDPENDPLLYTWHCVFLGELALAGGAHEHAGGGGTPYVGPAVSAIEPAYNVETPAAERTVDGDFCANARGDGKFTTAGTIAGSFETPGNYRITVLAKDPANPSVAGFLDLIVSAPEDRPDPLFNFAFSGSFQGGSGGSGQGSCDQLAPGTVCDRTEHAFKLDLPANNITVALSHAENGANEVSWTLFKGNKAVANGNDEATFSDPETFERGDYRIQVTLDQGISVSYDVVVSGEYKMDPSYKFESGAH